MHVSKRLLASCTDYGFVAASHALTGSCARGVQFGRFSRPLRQRSQCRAYRRHGLEILYAVLHAAARRVRRDGKRNTRSRSSSPAAIAFTLFLLGSADCKFNELELRNGTFKITSETKGFVSISPSSGTSATTFTVSGLLVGSGKFVIKDTKGHSLAVRVKVTL
ncbi:MAG TPA: hypothetical protein VIX83_00475 [Candidatus Cybelea sp.]